MSKRCRIILGYCLSVLIISLGIIVYNDRRLAILYNYMDETIGYEGCYIIGKFKTKGLDKIVIKEFISSVEINEGVEQILLGDSTKKTILDRSVVKEGDLAITNIEMYRNDICLFSLTNEPIRIGSGYYDEKLESLLIGVEKNQDTWLSYSIDKQEYTIKVLVSELYEVLTPSLDEYCENHSMIKQDFIDDVSRELFSVKQMQVMDATFEKLMLKLFEMNSFDLDERIIAQSAFDLYIMYNDLYSLSFDMNYTKDELLQYCIENSEKNVKQYLVIMNYGKSFKIWPTKRQLDEYCLENNCTLSDLSEFDKQSVYYSIISEIIYYELLEKYGEITIEYID